MPIVYMRYELNTIGKGRNTAFFFYVKSLHWIVNIFWKPFCQQLHNAMHIPIPFVQYYTIMSECQGWHAGWQLSDKGITTRRSLQSCVPTGLLFTPIGNPEQRELPMDAPSI